MFLCRNKIIKKANVPCFSNVQENKETPYRRFYQPYKDNGFVFCISTLR